MTFSCRFLFLGAWALAAVTGAVLLNNEEQHFFCDFQQRCTWKGAGDTWDYFKQSNGNIEIKGPPAVDGFNLVMVPKKPGNNTLLSPFMKRKATGCFTFEYYIDGPENTSLSLESISAKNGTKLLWARHSRFFTRGKNDNWRLGHIQINESEEFQLKFTAVSNGGLIALNNFRYVVGKDACPIRALAECDFEAGHSCAWSLDRAPEKAKFEVTEASKIRYLDHTTYSSQGKVAHLEWKSGETQAQIISPPFPRGDPAQCFTFAMRRAKNFTVTVNQLIYYSRRLWTQGNDQIWKSDPNMENNLEWVKVKVPVNSSHDLFQMAINVTADHPDASGVLMFDDVKLENEPCAAPVDCKFGDDICGWVMPLPYSTWSLGSGRLANLSGIDTTKNSYPAHFEKSLYTDYTMADLDKFSMLIESDKIESSSSFCVHLQFAVDNFGQHDTFQLAQLTQRENRILWRFEQAGLTQGVVHNVQIQAPQLSTMEPRRFSLSSLGSQAQTRISVREIKLVSGRCENSPITQDPSTLSPTTEAPITKAPITKAPTTEVPFVPSKLDRTKLILVEQMLKNARSDVQRAFEFITIRDDPVYVATEKILRNIDASIREIKRNLN